MMIFINEAYKVDALPFEYVSGFIQLLAPIAPHFSEELWVKLGKPEGISYVAWPTYDEEKTVVRLILGGLSIVGVAIIKRFVGSNNKL